MKSRFNPPNTKGNVTFSTYIDGHKLLEIGRWHQEQSRLLAKAETGFMSKAEKLLKEMKKQTEPTTSIIQARPIIMVGTRTTSTYVHLWYDVQLPTILETEGIRQPYQEQSLLSIILSDQSNADKAIEIEEVTREACQAYQRILPALECTNFLE